MLSLLLLLSAIVLILGYFFVRPTKVSWSALAPLPGGEQLAEIDDRTWETKSVFEQVERSLKMTPDDPALICLFQQTTDLDKLVARPIAPPTAQVNNKPYTLSYIQLHRIALRIAVGLRSYGAQPNTIMLMLIPNGAEYAVLLWVCLLLRITYVNLDPASLEISGFTELKHKLQTIKPQIVVVPEPSSGEAIDVAISELGLPQPIRVALSERHSSAVVHGWRSICDIAPSSELDCSEKEAEIISAARSENNPKRINSILFTSGTSGPPKGCPQSVYAISYALQSQEWLIDPESGTAKFAVMQPHNSRGIAPAQTLQTWRAGGAVVLTGQSFSVVDAVKAIKQVGATFMVLTPPMVHEFAIELAVRPLDVSCIKRIQIGGDAITKNVLSICTMLFPQAQVCVNQGMTEGPGVFVWPYLKVAPGLDLVEQIPFLGGQICPVGVVAPGAKVRICSISPQNTISVAKTGHLGQLHISCPSIINGYLRGGSEGSFYEDENGRWFNTGDLAMINSEGLVFIVGRGKDMIQCAGVVIAPAVIESCVSALSQNQTVVVAVPHHVLGAEPFAVVESFDNASGEQIKQHVRSVLGREYALGGIVSLKELGLVNFPVNATHKIVKSKVQAAVVNHLQRVSPR